MQNSWFEQMRAPMQSIEVLKNAIVGEMLHIKDNPKDRSISQHKIINFIEMLQNKSQHVLTFLKEESGMRKEELAIIEGHKTIKKSDKKKPDDVIWQNFYDRAREIKEMYKKSDQLPVQTENDVDFFRRIVFMPPYKQPEFSMEQSKGKYVDMHSIYINFVNICKAMEQKQGLRINDYLWFLQNMDKFDQFPLNKKMKHHHKYKTYLQELATYLEGFIKRSRPLFDIQGFLQNAEKKFEQKYEEGTVHGWQPEHDNTFEIEQQYCLYCDKIFLDRAYMDHLSGKNHVKNIQKKQDLDLNSPQEMQKIEQRQKQVKQQFREKHQQKKKEIALLEFKIMKMREELANTIYDTMNLVRKKQTRGYEEADQIVSQSSESEDADAPIYNPKNLPLGWDGKPIPYWLYKLHGLGIEYKCQICGNYSYWGRRAFQLHFQQWRHTYGMKCLKIPNTIHFKDVTTISDALALHQKLLRESQQLQFRPDLEEEFEDGEGNILNRRTYYDMKKQGLIQ